MHPAMEANKGNWKYNPEAASAAGKIGGVKSGEARRRKKSLNELATYMLQSPVPDQVKAKLATQFPGIDPDEMTAGALAVAGMVNAAANGNAYAFKVLADAELLEPKKDSDVDKLTAALKAAAKEL